MTVQRWSPLRRFPKALPAMHSRDSEVRSHAPRIGFRFSLVAGERSMSANPSPAIETSNPLAEPTPQTTNGPRPWNAASKPAGFGLPCARCRTYYAAELSECPVCKGTERVSPNPPLAAAQPSREETCPDPAALEEERERFLEEFKLRMLSPQTQSPESIACIKAGNHSSGPETATVCQSCYDHLQERVDVLEAALHMDIKEATQIVYDAVWADAADPSKTYENAAAALLAELRRRSGVTHTLGAMKPLAD
jgi:hypothetical protein